MMQFSLGSRSNLTVHEQGFPLAVEFAEEETVDHGGLPEPRFSADHHREVEALLD